MHCDELSRIISKSDLILCRPVTPHVTFLKTGFHIIYHVTDSSASDTRGKTDLAGMGEAQLFILDKYLF